MDYNIVIIAAVAAVIFLLMVAAHLGWRRVHALERELKLLDKLAGQEVRDSLLRDQAGPGELARWFGMSKASWICVPRVLAGAMAPGWQADMARLLRYMDEEFPGNPLATNNIELNVAAKSKGKFARLPEALTDYRNPRQNVLQAWRQGQSQP